MVAESTRGSIARCDQATVVGGKYLLRWNHLSPANRSNTGRCYLTVKRWEQSAECEHETPSDVAFNCSVC